MTSPHLKAVIFDIGGVVVASPFVTIAAYEREKGLPPHYINVSITRRGEQGAWQKFERGEIALFPFYEAFGRELSDTQSGNRWYTEYCRLRGKDCPPLPESLHVDGRELFGRMMRESTKFDEVVVEAIRRIRESGRWRVIALTNNYAKSELSITGESEGSASENPTVSALNRPPGFSVESELAFLGWNEGATPQRMRDLFDDFCDSSTLGMRKPDPAFYLLACERNNVRPEECIFLDDIGQNLKTAKTLGMETIHVPIGGSLLGIRELERKLGIRLTDGGDRRSKL